MTERPEPIVFCHGLFGWGAGELGGYPYFVCAERLIAELGDDAPPFLFPSTGPISSLHDQACELFAQLKGTRVNYGLDHSAKFGHARYARDYTGKGLYPEWGESRPIDFVAHSMGAPVVRMLQYLLETGFFSAEDETDYGTSSRWVRSVTSVAGVHNGSTLTWILGADETTGLLKKDAKAVRFVASLLERYEKLSRRYGKLDEFYDLHLDQWGIESGKSAASAVAALFETPAFVEGEDWAMFDLTPNSMERWNDALAEYPPTRYWSCSTRATVSLFGICDLPVPFFCHWFLIPFAFSMGTKFERKWRANDGMCPTWSQSAPMREGERGDWIALRRLSLTDHAEVAMLPHLWRIGGGKKLYRTIVSAIVDARNER